MIHEGTPNIVQRLPIATHMLCLALLAAAAAPAAAATFTVLNTDNVGPGSLRQAMTDANTACGSNVIEFAIPGAGPHTIALSSSLPAISCSLVVNGYSQPGSLMNTLTPEQGGLDTVLQVEIVGSNGTAFALVSGATFYTVTLQGLALHGFSDPIAGNSNLAGNSQLNVYGNFIGTTIDGQALPGVGNGGSALRSGQSSAQIGGIQPWQRNLISGGGNFGILLDGPAIIEGNLIGTDATGTTAIPNGSFGNGPGINVPATQANIRIGGASPDSRNIISGNRSFAISLVKQANGAQYVGLEIKGNYIGTDWSGLHPLPNGFTQAVRRCIRRRHPGVERAAGLDARDHRRIQSRRSEPDRLQQWRRHHRRGEQNRRRLRQSRQCDPWQSRRRSRQHRHRRERADTQRSRRRRQRCQQPAELARDHLSQSGR